MRRRWLEPRPEMVAGDSARKADATEWPLRGEILVHVDRLRTGLRADTIPRQGIRRHPRPRLRWPHPIGRFDAQRRFSGMR